MVSIGFLYLLNVLYVDFLVYLVPGRYGAFRVLRVEATNFRFPVYVVMVVSIGCDSICLVVLGVVSLHLNASNAIRVRAMGSIALRRVFPTSISRKLGLYLPNSEYGALLYDRGEGQRGRYRKGNSSRASNCSVAFGVVFHYLSVFSRTGLLLQFLFASRSRWTGCVLFCSK